MFINGKSYLQAVIPTPTGYLIDPQKRDHVLRSSESNTRFRSEGWFCKQNIPSGKIVSDIELKRALFLAVKSSPTYVWAGDGSRIGFEYLAPFSMIEETENQYVEVNEHTTYEPELCEWINYHWNRLSIMKGKNGLWYVFPHSLVYWVCLGKNVVSPGLRQAIIYGEHVEPYELFESHCSFEQDPCNLVNIWNEAEEKGKKTRKARIEPLNMDMPVQYQGDYPKQHVNADSWVNFTSSYGDGSYVGQNFYLPSPVDQKNLKSLLSRQHIEHVALNYMSKGFGKISEIAKVSPDLRRLLIVMFLNYRKHQKFSAFVNEKEGDYDYELQKKVIDFPEKLKGLAPIYFPFTP